MGSTNAIGTVFPFTYPDLDPNEAAGKKSLKAFARLPWEVSEWPPDGL